MLKKLDLDALIARRSRHYKRLPRFQQTNRRVFEVLRAFNALRADRSLSPKVHRELYRYFPIVFASLLEGHMKMLCRDLIDSGEPFLSHARDFRDIKLDIDCLIATSTKTVTAGELIAEQLGYSSLGQIEKNLSTLLRQDFTAELNKRLEREDASLGVDVFRRHIRGIIINTLRQRHIYCHELAIRFKPDVQDISIALKVLRVFLHVVEEHVWEVSGKDKAVELVKIRLAWNQLGNT